MELSTFRVPTTIEEVYYIPDFVNAEEEEYLLRKVNGSHYSIDIWSAANSKQDLGLKQCEMEDFTESQITGGELTPSNALIPQKLPSFITNYPDIIPRLRATGAFSSSKHGEPNHVIVNEYQPGQGIMPHEDGPTYHPVVATLSLGSHAVFSYHRYVPEQHHDTSGDSRILDTAGSAVGHSIDPSPVLSLLLEPRSVIITAKALYTHHLHAIEAVAQDAFASSAPDHDEGCRSSGHGVVVANWKMLTGERECRTARHGGVLERCTRVSLTCRDVERVVSGKVLGRTFIK